MSSARCDLVQASMFTIPTWPMDCCQRHTACDAFFILYQHNFDLPQTYTDYDSTSFILYLLGGIALQTTIILLFGNICSNSWYWPTTHTCQSPYFFHFHGDFHWKWHFVHPKKSCVHPDMPFQIQIKSRLNSIKKSNNFFFIKFYIPHYLCYCCMGDHMLTSISMA